MSFRQLAVLLPPLFAIVCAILFYLTGHELRIGLLHSDALYLPALFDDVLRQGGRLADWFLTPAPYFFPDYPLYLAAYLLGPDSYVRILIYAVLQCALVFAGTLALGRQLKTAAPLHAAAFGIVALIGLALTGEEPFVMLMSNATHFGEFVSAILLMAAWQRAERGGRGGLLALSAACLVAFATTLSDSLFLPYAALPLALTCALRLWADRGFLAGRRFRVLLPWSPVIAAGLGQMAYDAVVENPTRLKALMDFQHIGANLRDLARIASHLLDVMPMFVLCWLVFFLFALACATSLAVRRHAGRGPFGLPAPLAWLLVFWLISSAGTVAMWLLVSNIPAVPRYFIPAACWPVLLAPFVLAGLLQPARARGAVLAAILACCAAIGVATIHEWRTHGYDREYYSTDMSCLDQAIASRGLRYGIAEYWDAKYFQNFSHVGLVMAQYNDQLDEVHWITSKRYFRSAYDFALVGPHRDPPDNILPERVEAINGKPVEQVRCGGYTVMLYRPGALKVR